MTRLEERIRSGLQETADRIPDTAPTRAAKRLRSSRPAGVWVAVAAVVAVLVLFTPILFLGGSDLGTTTAGAPSPFLGTWVTTDLDGSAPTMVIQSSEGESVEMLVHDDFASMCSGAPSTMTGTGGFEGDDELIFPSPVLTCDDGSQPEALSGPPLAEQLQNLTFVHDQPTDRMSDNFGSVWTREAAEPSPGPTTPPPFEAEVAELLNGFLEARIAGEGAQQYLNDPAEDVPLLYVTSSGAPYERAEFEPVLGIEWPYGSAFKVRLLAGNTVVEQLFFNHDDPADFPADGRLWLDYHPHGFGTHIAPTTEDGQAVAMPVNFFDGEVTMQAAHPWIFADYPFGPLGRLIPEGPVGPTTDGGQRSDWDEFRVMADPAVAMGFPEALAKRTIEGRAAVTGCPTASPADAEALAESIRSYPRLEATAPVTVSAGRVEGLMMDVVIAAGATMTVAVDEQGNFCANGVLNPIFGTNSMIDVLDGVYAGRATGERMRLYLFDMPEGSSMRTMAIAIIAPESRFERAVEAAAPIVDSLEFHAP